MNTICHFRKCTLTNNELMAKVDYLTDELYKTGAIQTVHLRHIPARPNDDYDLVVGELILRFQELINQGQHNNNNQPGG